MQLRLSIYLREMTHIINEFSIYDESTIGDILSKMEIQQFTEQELKYLNDFVEVNRHLNEIHQLFDSYLFNFCNLHNYYELFFNDTIKEKQNFTSRYEIDHSISVNALTNGLISSAITLVSSMEVFVEELSEKQLIDESLEDIRAEWTCKAYGSNFLYRFGCFMRQFLQHNHLAVSVYREGLDIKCCFDFKQLLNTPHFNMKGKFRDELQKLVEEMVDGPYNHTRVSYTITIARFHVQIIELYAQYYDIIETAMSKVDEEWKGFISANPNAISKSSDDYNGYVFYCVDSTLHSFRPVPFFDEGFSPLKQRAKEIYLRESEELKGIKLVPFS